MAATMLTLILAVFSAGYQTAGPPSTTVTASIAPVEADLKAKLEREPRHIPHYLALARLYFDVRRPAEAEALLRRALTVQPDAVDVYRQLFLQFGQTHEYEKAIALATSWAALAPSSPEPPTMRAGGHLKRAEHGPKDAEDRMAMIAAGLADVDAALALKPDHIPALYIKGQLVALKATLVPPAERPAIEAERDALIERIKTANPHWNRRGPAPPVRVGSVIINPRKVHHVDPVYPEAARKARAQGPVLVEARINEKGIVTEARVLRSIPLLDQAALECVKQWRFAPTEINGSPVPIITTFTVDFTRAR
jgi:TonB family protein